MVRKLLLEESLKIRGRKDSKVGQKPGSRCRDLQMSLLFDSLLSFLSHASMQLEVVALLFSDVLLMTKFQKKGERLKVVRPPLALDRTSCMLLKDGCE